MIKISMREFTRNVAEYISRVNHGEKFVITKRNKSVADIVPHKGDKIKPGWSTVLPRKKLKSKASASELYLKYKNEEKY